MYGERRLDDSALRAAREAVELVLRGHEPYPALAVDRHWNLVSFNRAVPPLLAGVSAELLVPPINVMRLSLHPKGLAPRILNLAQWREHVFARLRQQIATSADAQLEALLGALQRYPAPAGTPVPGDATMVVPLQFDSPAGVLSLIGTTTVFGTPVDVTLSELALETFFPADEATATALRALYAEHVAA